MIVLKVTINLLATSLLISSQITSASCQQETSLEIPKNWNEVFRNLLQEHPLVILLDDIDGDVELEVRDALLSLDHPGTVLWRRSSYTSDTTTKFGPLKNIQFIWSFVCLIEEKRSKSQASRYLRELLEIGHGREDHFILVGHQSHISTFLKSPVIQKFKNILGLAIDSYAVHQRAVMDGSPFLKSKFKVSGYLPPEGHSITTAHLNGHHFRISGSKFPPYMDVVYHKGKRVIMGINYEIFREGAAAFNYTFELNKESEWKSTGVRLKNGTWNGVFGDILYDRADIASVSSQSIDRTGLADFAGPFGKADIIFLTAPGEVYLGRYEIFSAYSIPEWSTTLGLFILFLILCNYGLRYHFIESGQRVPSTGDVFGRAFLLSWALTLEQNLANRRETHQGVRSLMVIWAALIIIIGNGYKSNLSANTSIPEREAKVRTFEELNLSNEYKVYFDVSGSSAYDRFRQGSNEGLENLVRRTKPLVNSTECVVRAFMEPRTVCIGWEFTMKIAATRNLTISQFSNPLQRSSDSIEPSWEAFALQKNSIFTDAFQRIGMSCYESGLKEYWKKWLVNIYRENSLIWTATHNHTGLIEKLERLRRKSRSETQPLTKGNLEQIFLVLFMGICVSLFCFLMEVVIRRREATGRGRTLFLRKGNSQKGQIQIIQIKTIDYAP